MNKEELTTTLPMLQGTSHCSCLEHCFSFSEFATHVMSARHVVSTLRRLRLPPLDLNSLTENI